MDYIESHFDVSAYSSPPEVVRYTDSQSRFLPIRVTSDGYQYDILISGKFNNSMLLVDAREVEDIYDDKSEAITVNDCVGLCQRVLGLKINEIAKLAGVSRATLDLHRKGSNVKDMGRYHMLFSFATKVEKLYGETIKLGVRNVLIEKRTLAQHLVLLSEDLDSAFSIIDEVHEKIGKISIAKTNNDLQKTNARLSGIGRIA
ncbi:hypothetical protein [uncultured Ferrimonas sp.]|uniref:hypothetical protein n=1 Tax=uncultured Ferrimonas sp. TaxID=432640 RepID=UPI00261B9DC5|nr:hypothetical protein [uncultured Ferrimonas sp.]